MVGTFPEAWQEVCLIAIQRAGGSPILYAACTEDLDIGEPDYPWESIPTIAGGRISKQSPQEDGELTLKLYPVSVSEADNQGLFAAFVGGTIIFLSIIASELYRLVKKNQIGVQAANS